jgi:hypothetical protein
MQRVYTTADYKLKRGRFLILSTLRGDKCTEVADDIDEGSEAANEIAVSLQDPERRASKVDNYSIHEGFVIINSTNSRDCAQALSAHNRKEAEECLARFLDDLNAY